jgi:hypothetical protein
VWPAPTFLQGRRHMVAFEEEEEEEEEEVPDHQDLITLRDA